MAAASTQLDVSKIRLDGGTQIRAEINQSRVEELAELLREGHTFKDPIVVFYDGTDYWNGDGFHRTLATIEASLATIDADVRSGTREDAIEYACGANATHGLPRKNEDKRNAVRTLLGLSKWQNRTQEEIARQCGVSQRFVSTIQREMFPDRFQNGSKNSTNQPMEPSEVVEEGRIRTPGNDTEKRETVEQFFSDFPGSEELSNREIAKRCGVSEGLVRKVKKELADEKQRLEQEEAARNASVVVPEPEIEPEPILTWEPEIPEPEISTATTEPLVEPEPPQSEIEPVSDTPISEEPEPTPEPEIPIVEPVAGIVEVEPIEEPVLEPQVIPEPEPEQQEVTVDPEPESTPEPMIEEEPATINISGVLAPSEEVLREREIKRQQTQERNEQLRERGAELPQGKYACLVVDPPWPMKKIEREVRPNQVEFDYPTMSEEELKDFELPSLAGDDCHLYLWTTQKYLPMALRLAEHWGFKYQCLMTWVKNVGPTPFSWMYTTEHVLFCSKGNLPMLAIGRRLDFVAKGREHSRKPDVFYDLVKEVSPGPRIDVFSRERRDGFEQYGYEVEKYVSA